MFFAHFIPCRSKFLYNIFLRPEVWEYYLWILSDFIWLYFVSNFKADFSRWSTLDWWCFSFSALKVSFHCHLASTISNEKWAVILIQLYVTYLFSLVPFNIFSYFLVSSNITVICLGVVFLRFIWLELVDLLEEFMAIVSLIFFHQYLFPLLLEFQLHIY